MDISTSPIRLINVQVTFQRNVVQINDSVQISLTLSSNFPEPVELNYVVLRLEQLKLERRASISTPTPPPTSSPTATPTKSPTCSESNVALQPQTVLVSAVELLFFVRTKKLFTETV